MLLWEFHIMCLIPIHFPVLPCPPPPPKKHHFFSITYSFIVVLLGAAVCCTVYPSAKASLLANVHCSGLLVWFKPISSILDPHWDFPLLSCYHSKPWSSWGYSSTVLVLSCTTTLLHVHIVLHVLQLVIDGVDVKVGQLKALDGNWVVTKLVNPGLHQELPSQGRAGLGLLCPPHWGQLSQSKQGVGSTQ